MHPTRLSLLQKLSATVRTLPGHVRGAAVVEFAIVVIPFLAVLFAALATSLAYFAQQGLETVAVSAGRSLLVGTTQAAAPSKAQFKTQVCAKLPAYMRCSNLMVSVDKSSDFSTADTDGPDITFAANGAPVDNFPFNMGAAGEIVTLRLYYVWQLPSVNLGFDISNLSNGRRLLIATSVSKTEQYS